MYFFLYIWIQLLHFYLENSVFKLHFKYGLLDGNAYILLTKISYLK